MLILIFACNIVFSQKKIDSLLDIVINTSMISLSDTDEQVDFLNTIYIADQEIREEWLLADEQLEKKSKEYNVFWKKLRLTDSILFSKTKEYLDVFKNPNIKHGDMACYTPQLIFHHASAANFPNLIEMKMNYFPMFYEAYRNNIIEENAIWFYLFRLYQQVKKQTYTNYELGDEEQIEEMIDLLHLKRN